MPKQSELKPCGYAACPTLYRPERAHSRYCSDQCRALAHYHRKRGETVQDARLCRCGRSYPARNGEYCSRACAERAAAAVQRAAVLAMLKSHCANRGWTLYVGSGETGDLPDALAYHPELGVRYLRVSRFASGGDSACWLEAGKLYMAPPLPSG